MATMAMGKVAMDTEGIPTDIMVLEILGMEEMVMETMNMETMVMWSTKRRSITDEPATEAVETPLHCPSVLIPSLFRFMSNH